jgi:hypothetical protein
MQLGHQSSLSPKPKRDYTVFRESPVGGSFRRGLRWGGDRTLLLFGTTRMDAEGWEEVRVISPCTAHFTSFLRKAYSQSLLHKWRGSLIIPDPRYKLT